MLILILLVVVEHPLRVAPRVQTRAGHEHRRIDSPRPPPRHDPVSLALTPRTAAPLCTLLRRWRTLVGSRPPRSALGGWKLA